MFNSPTSNDFGKTLSLLWLFAILNTLFKDIHGMAKASTINEILSGHMYGNPVTEGALLGGAIAVQILLLTMLLSSVLAPRIVRRINLLASPLAMVGVLFVPPTGADDYFNVAVLIASFLTIFLLSWSWRPPVPSDGHKGHSSNYPTASDALKT